MFRLKELRTENGLTQNQVAEILKIKQNTYSQYECGTRTIPIESLIVLANFYDTSIDYIVNNSNDPSPHK
ncbi:MAG: helix-turn-helix transcriptional regulator [Eubacteriales bacterium]|nr:helix-turn-helix transcriptional regulator [Christensenellaceae bacterium]MDY2750868.1 helix-turn-helix transcriptional regulator [Eubacteriales bacterium]